VKKNNSTFNRNWKSRKLHKFQSWLWTSVHLWLSKKHNYYYSYKQGKIMGRKIKSQTIWRRAPYS